MSETSTKIQSNSYSKLPKKQIILTMAGIMLSTLTVSLALVTYSRGLDPDNVLSPSLATVGDILTVLCLLVSIKLVTGF